MQLYMKQKVFSWGDKFSVYNENSEETYRVQGEVFSLGKKLHLYDTNDRELLFIRQKLFSFRPRYFIEQGGQTLGTVVKEFTFFRQKYTIEGLGWQVEGNFTAHEYAITAGGATIATVSKEWFSFGDAYHIDIVPGVESALVLAVVLVIDACLESEAAAASGNT